MNRRKAIAYVAGAIAARNPLFAQSGLAPQPAAEITYRPESREWQQHSEWVGRVLDRMLAIRPGMTRDHVETVLTSDGGKSTRTHQVYLSRDCPYFKVALVFHPVSQDLPLERLSIDPGACARDKILSMSRPYVERENME
jgi:hypothetical protein